MGISVSISVRKEDGARGASGVISMGMRMRRLLYGLLLRLRRRLGGNARVGRMEMSVLPRLWWRLLLAKGGNYDFGRSGLMQ